MIDLLRLYLLINVYIEPFFLGRGVTLFVFLRRKNIPSMLKRELVVVVFEESEKK